MYVVRNDRPATRRPWHPQPGRLNPHVDREVDATAAKMREVEGDWLFQQASADGRRRLLVEAGLLPR